MRGASARVRAAAGACVRIHVRGRGRERTRTWRSLPDDIAGVTVLDRQVEKVGFRLDLCCLGLSTCHLCARWRMRGEVRVCNLGGGCGHEGFHAREDA